MPGPGLSGVGKLPKIRLFRTFIEGVASDHRLKGLVRAIWTLDNGSEEGLFMIERSAHGQDFKKIRLLLLARRLALVLPLAASSMAEAHVSGQILHSNGPLP